MCPAVPDARLSNYRLERLLGAGGMGSVYLARDLALDRDVAIKFISPDKAGDEGARRRLIREARAAAALDHPNICTVHQVIVEPDGRACIVMQYVEGETLATTLRSGPLEPRLALSVTCDLAEALSAAHKRGIIHRDLKPQNVIITGDRRAKLLDFGIARVSELATTTTGDATPTSLTMPGVFVGTPPYMSPEQFQQQPLDGRSDLFSLGALLFECLTGRRAFDGHSQIELFTQVLNHHPQPCRRCALSSRTATTKYAGDCWPNIRTTGSARPRSCWARCAYSRLTRLVRHRPRRSNRRLQGPVAFSIVASC